jgi:hypothetical protein
MGEYEVEIRRCQHIKTNGTQCGSPALRDQKFCFYHSESRPERVEVCGEDGKALGQVLVPVFEDASAIQVMARQVAMLVLGGKIDTKKAGVVLYALQIASSNLRQVEIEKPRPQQVVVDADKVVETPLGMTPWSRREGGHEREEIAMGLPGELAAKMRREVLAAREQYQKALKNIKREADELRGYVDCIEPLTADRWKHYIYLATERMDEFLKWG